MPELIKRDIRCKHTELSLIIKKIALKIYWKQFDNDKAFDIYFINLLRYSSYFQTKNYIFNNAREDNKLLHFPN